VTGNPPVRRRMIGAALRRYRENVGFPLDTAARVLECDRSKISRIETGQRGIRAKELRELLGEYGVPQPEQEVLIAIAHADRGRGWWQPYADVLPEPAQDYVLMESLASQVLGFEPQRIPDLLQTPRYAAAQVEAGCAGLTSQQRDRAVEVILTRQAMLLERGARFEVVIGEAALHQSVGGADVMREQFRHLIAIADPGEPDPLVMIQVLPFSSGAQPGISSGPLAILRYAAAPSLGAVYLTTLSGGVVLEEAAQVAGYIRAFSELRSAARTPAASAALLRDMARA
jgi:transcriptional regulator with XRE-family HTH domain